MSNTVNPPDIGLDRTPESTAQIKNFKAQLMNKGNAKSTALVASNVTPIAQAIDVPQDPDEIAEPYEYTAESLEEDVAVDYAEEQPEAASAHAGKTEFIDPLHAITRYLESAPAKEEVKIIGSFGKIGFKAINVSINDYGVAVIIKKDSIQFEPNINTELKIAYRGNEFNVVYAGGFFTFPKIPFTFVSFLRISEN